MLRAVFVLKLSFAVCISAFAEDPLPYNVDHPAVARYHHRSHKVVVSGDVTDTQGQAVANAKVFAFGYPQLVFHPYPTIPSLELGRSTTDRTGAFSFKSGTLADTSHFLCVIAPGHGTKFVEFNPDRDAVNVGKIKLPTERPVHGKVVGPDGKPAGQVTIEVRSMILPESPTRWLLRWFGSPHPGETLRPLVTKTNDDGTFILRGIPKGAVELWIRIDDERFALYERSNWIGSIRFQEGIIELKDDAEKPVEIRLSKPIYVSGVVRRKDTGAALPGAWVGVAFADIREPADTHSAAIWTQTDDQGRYRVRGGPWASHVHVYAFAPPGTPCPDWSAGPVEVKKNQAEIKLPVTMPVGILVRGKIIEKGTGKPVAGAGYVYIFRRDKAKTLSRDDAGRAYWSNEYHYRYSAADGSFEQPVPAGDSGVILVKAPDSSYVSGFSSYGEIMEGKPRGWWSVYEGIANVETKPDTKGLTITIPLTPGVKAVGTVVGPKGEPVPHGVVFTATLQHTHRQQFSGGEQWWRPITDGRFTVEGCDPSAPTEIYFLDVEHQWGATVRFDPKTQAGRPLNVTLQPCGSARVRFLDPQKRPLTKQDTEQAIDDYTALGVGFRASVLDVIALPSGLHFGIQAYQFDRERYYMLAPNADGIVVFPGLIPGAPYKWVVANPNDVDKGPHRVVAVTVKPGETTDLGDAIIHLDKSIK